ncbi:MAG: hypothetical protein KJO35_10275, partial [Gammaproteobacteria bacterium]|nr:hypothetical protein [Gammaproteobacteria bacterium]
YDIAASGAIGAVFNGDLVTQMPGLMALRAEGVFAGDKVTPVMISDGEFFRLSNGGGAIEEPASTDFRAGILLGLLRMGILHNLANLSVATAPDGIDGKVRQWVQVNSFSWHKPVTTGETGAAIGFDLQVGGKPAGRVVLWYDQATHLPLKREQVVHFETGEMRVVEQYRIETDGMIGPCRFDRDGITLSDSGV